MISLADFPDADPIEIFVEVSFIGCCDYSVLSIPVISTSPFKWLYDQNIETFEHGVDYWVSTDDLVENNACSFDCGNYQVNWYVTWNTVTETIDSSHPVFTIG